MRRALSIVFALAILSPLYLVAQPGPGTGVATITWNPPTTYVDGQPLVIADYQLWREVNSGGTYERYQVLGAGLTSFVDAGLWNGDYCYALSTRDQNGLESVLSDMGCKFVNEVGNEIIPLPPTNIVVQ